MENTQQFFDLREFLLLLLKKAKLFIIFAVVLAVLGGAFGFLTSGSDDFISTSSASVNTKNDISTDATALTSIMSSIKETLNGDFFYTGILEQIRSDMNNAEFESLFGNSKQPSIASLKTVIRLYVNGNLVLVDVTGDEKLVAEASEIAIKYVAERLSENINSINITVQRNQLVNKSLQTGDTAKSRAIKFAVLGFAGGIVLAALWIFFFDVMSLKVTSKEDLKKFKLPVSLLPDNGKDPVELKKATVSALSLLSKGENEIPPVVIGVTASAKTLSVSQGELCQSLCSMISSSDVSCTIKTTKGDSLQNAKAFCAACRETSNVTLMPLDNIAQSLDAMNIAACCDGIIIAEQCKISRTDEIQSVILAACDVGARPLGILLLQKPDSKK